MIKAGYYTGKAIPGSVSIEESKPNERGETFPTVVVGLSIYGEDGPAGEVTTFLYFSEKAEPHSLAKLKAMGYDGGSIERAALEKEVQIEVKYEEYKGKQSMKVDIKAGGFTPKNPLNDRQKRSFEDRLTGILSRSDKSPAIPF